MLFTGSRATETGERIRDDARRNAEFVGSTLHRRHTDRRRESPNTIKELGAWGDDRVSVGDVTLSHEHAKEGEPVVGQGLARREAMPSPPASDVRRTEPLEDRGPCRPDRGDGRSSAPGERPAGRQINLSSEHARTAHVRGRIIFEQGSDMDP
jgi:hypothetical protein